MILCLYIFVTVVVVVVNIFFTWQSSLKQAQLQLIKNTGKIHTYTRFRRGSSLHCCICRPNRGNATTTTTTSALNMSSSQKKKERKSEKRRANTFLANCLWNGTNIAYYWKRRVQHWITTNRTITNKTK